MESTKENQTEELSWGEEITLPFPYWQVMHDPILQEAVTNRAYIMFLERRNRLRWKKRLPGPKQIALWLLRVALIVLSLVLLIPTFGFSLLFLLNLPLIKYLFQSKEIHRSYPTSVNQVISQEGYHRQSLLDLWTAGVTGLEIVYAIYLESQERYRWTVFWFVTISTCLAMIAFTFPFHPSKIVVFNMAFAYFCYELFYYRYDRAASKLICEELPELMRSWRQDHLSIPSSAKILFLTGWRWACWIGFIVLQLSVLGRACFGEYTHLLFYSTFFFFLAALILRKMRFPLQYTVEGQFEDLLRSEANLSFAVFITGNVLHDPDGVSWAKWFYDPQREWRQNEEILNEEYILPTEDLKNTAEEETEKLPPKPETLPILNLPPLESGEGHSPMHQGLIEPDNMGSDPGANLEENNPHR